MSLKKLKFLILLALMAAGCMTAGEKSTCEEPKVITIRDTVFVAVHDTTRVTIRDTILASLSNPGSLFGVWEGQASTGVKVLLAFTSSSVFEAEFTTNIGNVNPSGYISRLDSVQAAVTWAGTNNVTWVFNLSGNTLMIQEVGRQLFPGGSVTLHRR